MEVDMHNALKINVLEKLVHQLLLMIIP